MRGLLADVNVQGHLPYLRQLMVNLCLWPVLAELNLALVTFRDLDLPPHLDDRSLWNHCQEQGWALFTENRNHYGLDSLNATLMDSWRVGHFPVLTLANKGKFDHSRQYAARVATDIAELLVRPPRMYHLASAARHASFHSERIRP
jgi:hypothetical protein